jgi:hypothetical protein
LKIEFSLVKLGCVSRVGTVLLLLTEFCGGWGMKMVIVYCPYPPKKPEESSRDMCNYLIMSITF